MVVAKEVRTNALDFFGGYESYVKQRTDLVRSAVNRTRSEVLKNLSERLYASGKIPNPMFIQEMIYHDRPVELPMETYSDICLALGMPLFIDLGGELKPTEREYWTNKLGVATTSPDTPGFISVEGKLAVQAAIEAEKIFRAKAA